MASPPHPADPLHGDVADTAVTVSAPDEAALQRLLDHLLTVAGTGGGVLHARLDGPADACRYALEAAGLSDRATPVRGHAPSLSTLLHHVTTVTVDGIGTAGAVDLVNAWTDGLDLRISAADGSHAFWLRRREATRATVHVPREVEALTGLVGDLRPAVVEPPLAGTVAPSRPGVRLPRWPVLLGFAVALAVVTALAVIVTRSGRAPSEVGTTARVTVPVPSGSAVAADPTTGDLLMVGCCDPTATGRPAAAATWTWNGGDWRHIGTTLSPPYSRNLAMGYDTAAGTFVLWGGDTASHTWVWDRHADTWRSASGAGATPTGPAALVTAPDGTGLDMVVGDLGDGRLETWAWRGAGTTATAPWRRVGAVPASFATVPFAVAPDLARHRLVLVTEASTAAAATYVFDGTTWTAAGTTAGLPYDVNTQLAWDPTVQRVVALLPGDSAIPARGSASTAETWAWDGSAWSRETAAGAIGGRGRLAATSLGVVLFIGDRTDGGLPGVWRLVRLAGASPAWRFAAGGTRVTLHDPFVIDIGVVLNARALDVVPSTTIGIDDPAVAQAAVRAVPQPSAAGDHLHVMAIETDSVISLDTGRTICTCRIAEVLLTTLPSCPGPDVVRQESLVLVEATSGKVLDVFTNPVPAGVTVGTCAIP